MEIVNWEWPHLPGDLGKLAQLMSDISEECYCATWDTGTEFRLWEALTDPQDHRHWGQSIIEQEAIDEMRKLSASVGGWFDGDKLIPMAEWLAMYAAKPGPHRRPKP